VKWTFDVKPDGGLGAMQEYQLINGGYSTNAGAHWMLNPPSDWYIDSSKKIPGGWFEGFAGGKNSKGLFLGVPKFPSSVSLNIKPDKIDIPPGLTRSSGMKDGHWVDTFWNHSHTASLQYTYAGQQEKTLLAQTYGRQQDGKWVTTTDHSDDFIYQTLTFDKYEGTLLTSTTKRKVPNGNIVTFTGVWRSGKGMDSATGTETASDYLGFQSVTIEYGNGKASRRFGQFSSYQNDGYVTDTFNDKGTKVVKREVREKKGGAVVAVWTANDSNDLTIYRVNPTPDIKSDSFHYVWKSKEERGYAKGFTLVSYNAQMAKTMTFSVTPLRDGGRDEVTSDKYDWRAFTSYNRADKDWDWNYRELGPYNAGDSPNPQVPGFNEANPYQYWNRV
jgi:hypothetical protein